MLTTFPPLVTGLAEGFLATFALVVPALAGEDLDLVDDRVDLAIILLLLLMLVTVVLAVCTASSSFCPRR